MSEQSTPRWSVLPGDPLAFFGLSAGFARQDLRRSYSRLIRQFKPETHPAEFQRIRAAYEALDVQARYGKTSPAVSAFASASLWEAAAGAAASAARARPAAESSAGDENKRLPPPESAPSPVETASPASKRPPSSIPSAVPRRPTRAAQPSLAGRLAEESPAKVYEQLAASAEKSAYDFYGLALLADVVVPDDRHAFLKWLLTGLQRHGDDPGLARLLQEYLRMDLPTAELPRALVATSKVVTNDRFYFLTEAAWDRVLREADFALFRRTLDVCEANLHDCRIEAKTVFYVHLLRAALCKGDQPWLDEKFAVVEANAMEMDPSLEADWELTLLVREYCRYAGRFAAGGRLRRRMDQAIRAFCTQPSLQAARLFVECQNEIARDAFGVMESFPFPVPGDDDESRALALWHMISAWISDEIGYDPPELNQAHLRKQSMSVLMEFEPEIERLAVSYGLFCRLVTWSWLVLLVGGPLVLILGVMPGTISLPSLFIWPAASVSLHILHLRPKYLEPLLQRRFEKQFQSLYARSWRARMFRYLHAFGVPADLIEQQLLDLAREMGLDIWLAWLFQILRSDGGFQVFSTAQPFVR
jgi:hypothetical protein